MWVPIPGVLNGQRVDDIGPYGCHSLRSPMRFVSGEVFGSLYYGMGSWPHVMSTLCRQVGQFTADGWKPYARCVGCEQPKDEGYIAKVREDLQRRYE